MSIGFTTITRPMIEENTISMEMSQAPSLDELGLKSSEQRQLAKIGVRNGAQLRNLQRSAGEDTLSRHTGVDLSRIRSALDLARPRLDDVVADGVKGTPHAGPAPGLGPTNGGRPNVPEPAAPVRPMPDEPASAGPLPRDQNQPDRVAASPGGGNLADRLRSGVVARPGMGAHQPRRLQIDPNTRNIRLEGRNLIDAGRAPSARLDGRPLSLLDANTHSASFSLPPGRGSGILTIELPDGATEEFQLIQPTDGPT